MTVALWLKYFSKILWRPMPDFVALHTLVVPIFYLRMEMRVLFLLLIFNLNVKVFIGHTWVKKFGRFLLRLNFKD